MQTFLPYPDFAQSAKCLDMRRLGKQRVEVLQLLKALIAGGGWSNHPATKMWRGYEQALTDYGFAIIEEWVERGYKDSCRDKIYELISGVAENWWPGETVLPPWLGNEEFHAAHRSNLLRKDPVHYGQFGWTESDDLPYIWPVA
jgi:hypothetical protein